MGYCAGRRRRTSCRVSRDCGPTTTPSSQVFVSAVDTIEKNWSIQSAVKDCGETHICALGWYLRRPAFCFCSRLNRYLGSVWPGSPPGTNTTSTMREHPENSL